MARNSRSVTDNPGTQSESAGRALTLLLLILLTLCAAAGAQQRDSLRVLLQRTPQDTNRVMLLNSLARSLAGTQPASAVEPAREALNLAHRLGWRRGEADVLNTLGALQTNLGEYDSALMTFQHTLLLCDSLGDNAGAARALRNIGVVQRRIGNLDEARDFTLRSAERSRAIGDSLTWAKALVNLGNILVDMGRHREALTYFRRAEPVFEHSGDAFGISTVLNGMGNVLSNLGRKEEALRLYDRSLAVNEQRGDRRAVASLRINIGIIHDERGDTRQAIAALRAGISTAQEINAMDLIEIAGEKLAGLYARDGDYREAYRYLQLQTTMRDTLTSERRLHEINAIARRYERERHAQQVTLLEKEHELQEAELARETLLRNIIIGGLILAVLIALWVLHLARARKRSNTQLRHALEDLKRTQEQLIHAEKMATFGRLSSGIAHEILNPLNFIMNFAELSEPLAERIAADKSEERAEDARDLAENLRKIRDYGRRTEGIVRSLVQHAGLERGEKVRTNLNLLLRRAVEMAERALQPEEHPFPCAVELSLDTAVGDIPLIPREMTRVFINLFTNACESVHRRHAGDRTGYQPHILITTASTPDQIVIRFRDNGAGIPSELQPRVFEPFFTTKSAGEGTGLGLSVSYDIVVEGHGGSIDVESDPGRFAEFRISLPKSTD